MTDSSRRRDEKQKSALPKQSRKPIDPRDKGFEGSSSRRKGQSASSPTVKDYGRNEAAERARAAALDRIDFKSKDGFIIRNTAQAQASPHQPSTSSQNSNKLAVDSVLYVCPTICSDVLPKEAWRNIILNYLKRLEKTESGLAAALTLHTLNRNSDGIDTCISTIGVYLKNILTHPDEEKYRTIRLSNKVFQERVLPFKGVFEVLAEAGFEKTSVRGSDGKSEPVLQFKGNPKDERLAIMFDAVQTSKPLIPQVYRDPTVLEASAAKEMVYLPDDFYDLTLEELTKEYKSKMDKLEDDKMLRTKSMREREERRQMVKYRYALIRIRFPDSIYLQGTFARHETQRDIFQFVNESLSAPLMYKLVSPENHALNEMDKDKTILDLKLLPAVLFNFVPLDKSRVPKLKQTLLRSIKRI